MVESSKLEHLADTADLILEATKSARISEIGTDGAAQIPAENLHTRHPEVCVGIMQPLAAQPDSVGPRVGTLFLASPTQSGNENAGGSVNLGLYKIIQELMDTVSGIPEEVEKAKKEVHAQVSSAMGEELLRMEEQYEDLWCLLILWSEDVDIVPPTSSATVVKVKRRSLVEMVSRMEASRTSDEALSCLRAEN
uniref:Uncharacterized protein n=1 Tax=Mesocestoides corti TaxID=53468 RepID=A0A5K3FVN9_MESCO